VGITERGQLSAGSPGFRRLNPGHPVEMIDYIHANPVRRGLVERAKEWKWSSAGWREGKNSLRPDLVETGGLNPFYGRKRQES
jgi:hypothetical protein